MSTTGVSYTKTTVSPKAKNSFDDKQKRHFFNSAWVGLESLTACEAVVKAEGGWSEVVEEAKAQVGVLLQQPPHNITVFHNTTAGVQRIFLRLRHLLESSNPTLLMSDLEYPGIVSLVDENWQGRLVMAEVANLVWENEAALVEEALKHAIQIARPSVIYLSHVARTNGYCLNEGVIDFIREVNPRAVIIIDGAQACGNIHVGKSFLDKIDFYVTSGHKWLCARPTLGLVCAHNRWKLPDPAQSYSMRSGSGGTGNLDALRSLIAAVQDFNGASTSQGSTDRMLTIEEHNRMLARGFSDAMKEFGWYSVGAENEGLHSDSDKSSLWRWSGIVAYRNFDKKVAQKLERDGNSNCEGEFKTVQAFIEPEHWRDPSGGEAPGPRYILKCDPREETIVQMRPVTLRDEINPVPPSGCLRFCFHYYHSWEDVEFLLTSIKQAIELC